MHRLARKSTVGRPNGLHDQNLVDEMAHSFFTLLRQLPHFFICYLLCRASELENKIAAQCVQLHGGAGYLYDTPIARAYVDARVQTIYGGSNEVLKDLIARQIVTPARK